MIGIVFIAGLVIGASFAVIIIAVLQSDDDDQDDSL